MKYRETQLRVLSCLVGCCLWPALLNADIIKLKSGGEIRGEIKEKSIRTSPQITITTLIGATVVVNQDDIEFVSRRSLIVEQYESRAKFTADTVEAQWELAEWCLKNRLRNQRETHLRRIIELDPEHEDANRGLGHSLHDGKWMTRDEYMTSQGMVKYRNRYVTPQELELLEKTDSELKAEQEWFGKVRLWLGWITGRNDQRRDKGLANFKTINDPHAIPALSRNMRENKSPQMRAFYVVTLKQIPGEKVVKPLVWQSLFDASTEIRYESLNAIPEDHYKEARDEYVAELKHDMNLVVRRAGIGLLRVGNQTVIPDLIDALVTKHRYRVPVDDLSNTITASTGSGVSTSGGGGIPLPPQIAAMLANGQLPYGVQIDDSRSGRPKTKKMVTVKYDHKNNEILAALQRITGEDFGFDERTWELWWNAKKNGLVKPAPKTPAN